MALQGWALQVLAHDLGHQAGHKRNKPLSKTGLEKLFKNGLEKLWKNGLEKLMENYGKTVLEKLCLEKL